MIGTGRRKSWGKVTEPGRSKEEKKKDGKWDGEE